MNLKTQFDLKQTNGFISSPGGRWYIIDAKTQAGASVAFPISLTVDGTTANFTQNAILSNSNDNPLVIWSTNYVLTFQYVVGCSPNVSQSTMEVKPSIRTLTITSVPTVDNITLTNKVISNVVYANNTFRFDWNMYITSSLPGNLGGGIQNGVGGQNSSFAQTLPFPTTTHIEAYHNNTHVVGPSRVYTGDTFTYSKTITAVYDGVGVITNPASYTFTDDGVISPVTITWYTLSVAVTGTALVAPTYKWYYNNVQVLNFGNGNPSLLNQGTQLFTYKPGEYKVIVTSADTNCSYSVIVTI